MKPMSPAPNGTHRKGVKLVVKLFSSATIPACQSAIPPLTRRVRLTASASIDMATDFLIMLAPKVPVDTSASSHASRQDARLDVCKPVLDRTYDAQRKLVA